MPITKSLRENVRYYGITLPIDKRTKEYKEIIKTKNIDEKTYVKLLRTLVKQAKDKEQKRIKKVQKETQAQLSRLEAQKKISEVIQLKSKIKVIRPIQIKAISNKLFYMKPSQSAWKSFQSYTIENTRQELIDEFYNADTENPTITAIDINNFLKFYKVDEFLLKYFNHKIGFAFEFTEQERDRSRTNGTITETTETKNVTYRSKSKLILSKNDI